MDKYLQKLRAADEAIAGEIVDDRLAAFSHQEMMEAAIMLGRAQASDRISIAISAQVIRFLGHFEETKMYRALGHKDFVTFLKHSGLHGITKHKYYDGKKLLDKEGDPVFDALTVAGVPINVRGQLSAGDVQIEGDSIIIKGQTDSDDAIFNKDDHNAIVQHLRNLSAARRNDARKIDAITEKLNSIEAEHKGKMREVYDQLDTAKAATLADLSSNQHMMARTELGLCFSRMTEIASNLSAIEKDQFRDGVLEDIAAWRANLAAAYKTDGRAIKATPPIMSNASFAEAADEYFDNLDLDTENDGELAAKL